jgi:hypothetical protein
MENVKEIGIELKDTIEGMLSDDYQKRMIAEYQQLEIRINKLEKYFDKIKGCELDKEGEINFNILSIQLKIMKTYLAILKIRLQ